MDVSLAKPIVTDGMISEVERVLREEYFLRGETVSKFEDAFAEFIGTDAAVAVSSGTDALRLSLLASGIGSGDTVVTTPATFISTANAILSTGAEPIFVDVDLDTYTIDIDQLRQTVEEREEIAAVLPVHLYGYPVDIDAIRDAANGAKVIADACQAHGASLRDSKVGSLSDVAAFSFYPSKNMTVAGDGGMVTTDDSEVAETIKSLRDVGRGEGPTEHPRIGYTNRMNTMNAAFGLAQLDNLEDWNARRREIARSYNTAFRSLDGLILPPEPGPDRQSAWYLYVLRVRNRNSLQASLEEAGVETGIHYSSPVHLHPPYRKTGYQPGDFSEAERWADEVISLPMHPSLSDAQVDHVIEVVEGYSE